MSYYVHFYKQWMDIETSVEGTTIEPLFGTTIFKIRMDDRDEARQMAAAYVRKLWDREDIFKEWIPVGEKTENYRGLETSTANYDSKTGFYYSYIVETYKEEALLSFFFFSHKQPSLYIFCPMNSREFKRICRNRNFYIAQVYVKEEEIRQLEKDFCTPRAPRLEVIGAPAHDNQSHIVDYISHKMQLEKELEELLDIIRTIDQIKDLPKPWCDIFWKSLVQGVPVRTICKQYDISKDMYYRRIYTFLNRKTLGGN